MLGYAHYGRKASLAGGGRTPGLGLYPNQSYAARLLASATVLNNYSTPTFTRASTAYDPYNRTTAISGARRRRPMVLAPSLTAYADLIEPSHTNLCVRSSDFNNWGTKTDVTITSAAITTNDGTGTADRILEGSAGTAAVTSAAMTITAGRIVNAQIRLKFKATNNWIMVTVASDAMANGWRVWANVNTGVIGTQSAIGTGGVAGTASLVSLGNGEYQLISSGTVAAAATACQIQANSASADASTTRVNAADYYAWGAMVVMMAASATTGWASSYIATTTATVTRAADVLSVPYVLGQTGTILALCIPYGWTGDQDGTTTWLVFRADDATPSRIQRSSSTTSYFNRSDGAGTETGGYTPGLTSGALTHLGGTWNSSAVTAYLNGGSPNADSTLTPPYLTNTLVSIGSNGGFAAFSGWVALLAWPRALSAGELLALYTAYPVAA